MPIEASNPLSRKDELLNKWQLRTLTYEEALELKILLEKMAETADDAKKALIAVALLGLGMYFLTNQEKIHS